VGAIDRVGALTNYTPEGPELDIVAPSGHYTGICIGDVVTTDLVGQPGCSDYPGNVDYTNTFSGTSAAAPQVSGVAALLISKEPSLTSDQVKARIYSGADPWGPATQFGAGKLDALFTLAPLGSSITGPNIINSPGTYTWDSNPSGGSGTYAYQWRYRPIDSQTWTVVGTGRTYSRTISQSQINFWLQVTVTSMWRTTTSPVFVVQNEMTGCHPNC
jgi:subtilisin family serine protease